MVVMLAVACNTVDPGDWWLWERGNVSAGPSLVAFSLPICGPQLCGQMRGVVPGASLPRVGGIILCP